MPIENNLSQSMVLLVNMYLASLLFVGHCYGPADITDKTHHNPCPYGIYILVHLARKPAGWRCREGGQKLRSCDGGEQVRCDPHVWRGVKGRETSDVDDSGGRAVELVERWEKNF